MHVAPDTPYLIPLAPGEDATQALVIINGYKTDHRTQPEEFARNLAIVKQLGWSGSVSALWWDSSHHHIGSRAGLAAHWQMIKWRATYTGKNFFATALAPLEGRRLTIIAHSLGVRVAFYGLLAQQASGPLVEQLILLGGAVRRGKGEWPEVVAQVQARVLNLYNRDDDVLAITFRLGEMRRNSACGQKPLKLASPKVRNIDVTELIKTQHVSQHGGYWDVLPRALQGVSITLKQEGHRATASPTAPVETLS